MLADAIKEKYGEKEGLTIVDNTIVVWPYDEEQPSAEACEELLKSYLNEREHIFKRADEYPQLGDAADICYKQRQKQRMLVGKVRKVIDKVTCSDTKNIFELLTEAIQPVEDADNYDGAVSAVKRKYPKK